MAGGGGGGLAVELESVVFSYGSRHRLSVDYLSVHENERLAVMGPSGSGKSTLLRLIAGLERPMRGAIRLGGAVVDGGVFIPPAKRAIGLLGQELGLWPHLTAAQHIAFARSGGRRLRRETGDIELLDRVGLYGHADAVPARMSGGEQQRLALARILACQPRLLLLDEPFANVDPVLSADLLSLLDDLQRRSACARIMVTHSLDDAIRGSDRIAILYQGTLIQNAPWPDVSRRPANEWVKKLRNLSSC